MSKNEESSKIIRQHYEENLDGRLLIVGLNDDRCYNLQKSCLTFMKEALQSGKYRIDVFNAFSMFFNKMRHIDYYIDNNLSQKELEQIQQYGTITEVKHAIGESFLGKDAEDSLFSEHIGNLASKLLLRTYEDREDKDKFRLSSSIRNSKEPIILYSSGINDIMSEFWINPFNAKNLYYKERESWGYSADRTKGAKREECMGRLMDGHKSNFDKILGLNDQSKIAALGAYLYSKTKVYDEPFHDFILEYNDRLEELCKEYGINYVDLRFIENTRFQNAMHTYFKPMAGMISEAVLNSLAGTINDTREGTYKRTIYGATLGSWGMLKDMEAYRKALPTENRGHCERVLKLQIEEALREESVLKQVI